ncbi:hypothetical protein [Dyadobacter sp. OTU695]|uniref:hypothetical protein n=1 Tax=Dyadobacter sp. OTU695 TaxID=3043860 RepID=UPI00313AC325
MKKIILFIVAFGFLSTSLVIGQTIPKWNYGISASFGRDLYDRKINTAERIPGAVYDFKSDYSYGVGFWGERSITKSLSLIPRLNFTSQKLPNQTLCNCGSTSQFYQYERHYWGSAGIGLRGYLNSASRLKLFLEGGLSGDWFIGYTEAMNHEKDMKWNADGYRRFAPSGNLGIGLQYKRVGIIAEYNSNIARTFSRDDNVSPKVSILKSSYSIKMAFQISKLIVD